MFKTRCYACSQENCANRRPCDCSCHSTEKPTRTATDYRTIPPVYLVTAMVVRDDGSRKSRRTWGWHPTLADAKYAIHTNDGDIFENDYNYAVIEEVRAGSITLSETRWWFRVVRDAENDPAGVLRGWFEVTGAEEIPEPSWASGSINFGWG